MNIFNPVIGNDKPNCRCKDCLHGFWLRSLHDEKLKCYCELSHSIIFSSGLEKVLVCSGNEDDLNFSAYLKENVACTHCKNSLWYYRADSIQEYRITEKVLHGNFHDNLKNYDLITIIILNLGENPTTHKLLNLLHLLFMDLKSSEEKAKILHDDYHIEFSRDMKEELEKMGGLMEPLLNIAAKRAAKQAVAETKIKVAAETKKETLLENIRSLMKTLNLTAQQAMDALQISADKQKEFISLI